MRALRLQFGAQFGEIVDLAIIGDGQRAIGAGHRLRAAGDIDDRQTPMAQPHPRRGPHARSVGAAMRLRIGHRGDAGRIDRLGCGGIEDPGDAAHQLVRPALRSASALDRPERAHEMLHRRARIAPRQDFGRDMDRHRALRTAEQLGLQRLELHDLVVVRQRVADPVPGDDLALDRARCGHAHRRPAGKIGQVADAHPDIVLAERTDTERDEFLAFMLAAIDDDREIDSVALPVFVTTDQEMVGTGIIRRPGRTRRSSARDASPAPAAAR